MSLSATMKTKEDIDKLKAFTKLPENKAWLGRVASFYKRLETGPTINNFVDLKSASQSLLELAEMGITLIEAAKQGSDADDEELINKFSEALSVRFKASLSPEMAGYQQGKR